MQTTLYISQDGAQKPPSIRTPTFIAQTPGAAVDPFRLDRPPRRDDCCPVTDHEPFRKGEKYIENATTCHFAVTIPLPNVIWMCGAMNAHGTSVVSVRVA